jgi:hypothetical protein
LTGESLIVKAQGHLDLHLGHEAHRLDDVPPLLGHMGRGTLDALDVTWARGFDGVSHG